MTFIHKYDNVLIIRNNKNKKNMQTSESRQRTSSNDPEELLLRKQEADSVILGLLGNRREFFADPEKRLEFLRDQDADSVMGIAKYVNARLRGRKARELRNDVDEQGSQLMLLHTPSAQDKHEAFRRGYEAIKEYLGSTEESTEEQLRKTALATEALIIWTHAFNDGNGRTSRFIGKFIESGTSDIDGLIEETSSNLNRGNVFDTKRTSKEGMISEADNTEIMLDDDEREELRVLANDKPNDIEAMYLSVKDLLESQELQDRATRYRRKIGKMSLCA